MRLFHIASLADWRAAQAAGRYTTSTRGRTLAEEGFIHASRADQWQAVRERWYGGVEEPLVLLVIDANRLDVPVVEEPPPGSAPGSETFPHLYGALDPRAVVQVLPLDDATAARVASGTGSESFSRLFFAEMFANLALALLVMAAITVGVLVGGSVAEGAGTLVGMLAGAALGLVAAVALHRRRRRTGNT